jgi:ribosomal protein S18 acetylase RimI-like enzyme
VRSAPSRIRIGRRAPAWLLEAGAFHLIGSPDLSRAPGLPPGFRLLEVGAADLPRLATCRAMDEPEEGVRLFQRRLDEGARAFGVEDERGALLGYLWFRVGAYVAEDEDRFRMALAPDEAYLFDAWLTPEARGRDVNQGMDVEAIQALGREGVRRFYATINVRNQRSIRAHEKVGALHVMTVYYLRSQLAGLVVHATRDPKLKNVQIGERDYVVRPAATMAASRSLGRRVSVTRLTGEADWRSFRARAEALEAASPPSPWAGWAFWFTAWERAHDRAPAWLVEVSDDARPLAMAVLREEPARRGGLTMRTLRAFDQVHFMRAPAALARADAGEEAWAALARGIDEACRESGADLVTLYRQDSAAATRLAEALRAAGRAPRLATFTQAARVVIDGDWEALAAGPFKKTRKNVARTRRKLQRERGNAPALEVVDARALDDAGYGRALARYEALEDLSWQGDWERGSARVDPEARRRYDRAVFEIWRARGLLELRFLCVGDQDAAFALCLRDPARTWVLRIGFDPAYKDYGAGRMLLLESLAEVQGEARRVFELGGEVVGWKTRWATEMQDVLSLEWAGPGWKGRLWAAVQQARATRRAPSPSRA